MLDKRGRQADRPYEVGRDGGHHQRIIDSATRLVRLHDTGVIEQHVEIDRDRPQSTAPLRQTQCRLYGSIDDASSDGSA
jgi:hypothetical protein